MTIFKEKNILQDGTFKQLLHDRSELLLALNDLDQLLCCRLVPLPVPPQVQQLVHLQHIESFLRRCHTAFVYQAPPQGRHIAQILVHCYMLTQ